MLRRSSSAVATSREGPKLPKKTRVDVLTEAGFRCAVPTCRGILAMDLHHITEVSKGGGNTPANLIALCPNCHRLYHNGIITQDAIYTYKAMLVALSHAFDREAIDLLLFLDKIPAQHQNYLIVSGDGLLKFASLMAADLVKCSKIQQDGWKQAIGAVVTYVVELNEKGRLIVAAWRDGDRNAVAKALGEIAPNLI
jgi:HNH endonuclease